MRKVECLVGREILTFREGDVWVAVWVRFDLLAQGDTEREAVQRLVRTIAHQAIADAERGDLNSFGSAPPVSRELLRRWRGAHARSHSNLRRVG